jgi:large subunit ribosomal protein L13
MQKTYQLKGKDIKRDWQLVDAKGKVLGRLSTQIATILIGKNKVNYTPHMDMGDYVVVVNAKDIVLTGDKVNQKTYKSHSGYPGGFKEVHASKWMEERPSQIVKKAIMGMLPDNRLKKKRLARLKIFDDARHNFQDKFRSGKDMKA